MAQAPTTYDSWGGAWGAAWGVSWTHTIRSAHRPGYDPRRAIILADDLKVIEAVEDFLRRQPWRR